MKVLLVIILFLTGCMAPPVKQPYDPLYALCLTDDYSRHSDAELAECGRWLRQRVGPPTGVAPSSTYTIFGANGTTSFLSCAGQTCFEFKQQPPPR